MGLLPVIAVTGCPDSSIRMLLFPVIALHKPGEALDFAFQFLRP
jgi:hypothetical protein